jgi:hypothetical protein
VVRAAKPKPLSRQRVTKVQNLAKTRPLKGLTRSKEAFLILSSCSPSGRCPTFDRCTLNWASIRGLSRAFTGRELHPGEARLVFCARRSLAALKAELVAFVAQQIWVAAPRPLC